MTTLGERDLKSIHQTRSTCCKDCLMLITNDRIIELPPLIMNLHLRRNSMEFLSPQSGRLRFSITDASDF